MANRGAYSGLATEEGGMGGIESAMGAPFAAAGGMTWWQWLLLAFGIVLIAYFGVGAGMGIDAWVNDDPRKCRDLPPHRQTIHREIFVFGNSIDDMGNWLAYINDPLAYHVNGTGIIIPGTTEYIAPPAGPNKFAINYINPMGRFGQGWNGMDYVAQKYNQHSHGQFGMSPYPSHKVSDFDELSTAFMVNFAIGGATADGNVYNAFNLPLPHSYSQTGGPHGYNSQVAEFAAKLAVSDGYQIKENTWFFYNFVGGNDIPLIANCSDPSACIANFTSTHLNNLVALYDLGMRNLILTYVNGGFEFSPSVMKTDPSGVAAVNLDGLAGVIYNDFALGLDFAIVLAMPELNLIFINITDIIDPVAINPIPEGIRVTLATDPSPLGSPAFPFPTFLDGKIVYNAQYTNTFFYDDNHPTEAGSRWYAQTFIRYLDSQFNLCNSAPS